jgi:glycine/D-amino acid oxidase-like deaminating enzyme
MSDTQTSTPTKSVIVVGGGIIGTSIAYHLTRAGASVTLIDADAIGGEATARSWAWTNASYGNAKPYFDLRVRSMALWDDLKRELADLPYRRTGTLYADNDRFSVEAFVENHTAWGYDCRLITRDQAKQYEPAIQVLEGPLALAESEGQVEATAAAEIFAREARKAGAMVFTGLGIDAVSVDGTGRVDGVVLDGAPVKADEVVVASGTETPRIVEPLGIKLPMRSPSGLLATTKPLPPLFDRLILLPDLHVRQLPDGSLLAGTSFTGEASDAAPEAQAEALVQRVREMIAGAEDAELSHWTVGYRPVPEDGLPAVGRPAHIDGIYVATMHSGVTLAPAVGQFAAREILDGERDPLLGPFGLERFQ